VTRRTVAVLGADGTLLATVAAPAQPWVLALAISATGLVILLSVWPLIATTPLRRPAATRHARHRGNPWWHRTN
jgi:hypothetical protein